ncbi:MAG: hypothetical protein BGO98_33420 [Myxococcales bacterium 68-20]|nr:MAG: hypothetical protein BGO98_33420 [Myxococcales bacterium 68-20]
MASMVVTFVENGGSRFDDGEAVLQATVARARRARPRLEIESSAFVAHLARHVGRDADVAATLAAVHVEDLYLACACALGSEAAIATFDTELLSPAIEYARRVHRRVDGLIDEAAQNLRMRLLVREPEREPAILTYTGRSPLGAWLRVTAIREARYLLRRGARRAAVDGAAADPARQVGPATRVGSPELALLKREGLGLMGDALERALQALDERERALLRLYFIEGMSLAALGRIYHVHESTMARRLQALRSRLLDDVKQDLSIGTTSVHDLRAIVESELDVHLSEVLRRRG